MSVEEIFKIIFGIFVISPFWIKIIMILIIIGIPMLILEKIKEIKEKAHKEIKINSEYNHISSLMDSDVEKSFDKLMDSRNHGHITDEKYEEILLSIIIKKPILEGIEEMAEFYKKKNDIRRYKHWIEYAAKSGSIKGIIEHYGFSDYDVISESYNEILSCIEKSKTIRRDQEGNINYLIGIVQYKLGNIDEAKQNFRKSDVNDLLVKNMLLKCSIKENDISEAEKVLMELEGKEFNIDKQCYLSIYNYYVSQRGSSNYNYEKELLYSEKYALCEDANCDIANQIRGDSYYNLAIKLQRETEDKDFISTKALNSYKKAIEFGNVESMYLLGEYYWSGNGGRNYFYVIKYFIEAKQKGHEKVVDILNKYGFDGILIKSKNTQDVSYYFSDNYTLTVNGDIFDDLQMLFGLRYKSYLVVSSFENTYKAEFKSFEDLLQGIFQLYSDSIAYMMKWCIDLLVSMDIDMYGPEDILEACEDFSLLDKVPIFLRKIDEIDRRAEQLTLQTNYSKMTRTYWTGIGFGNSIGSTIRASIQASVSAGVMNLGSSIMHGIGDWIVESINSSELKSMGKKIFLSPETMKEFSNAVREACLDIVDVVMDMLNKNNIKNSIILKGSIVFKNEKLDKINDRKLLTKITNNLSANRNDYAFALLVEAIRRNPFDEDIFKKLFELAIQKDGEDVEKVYQSCIRYAGDFGFGLESYQIL